MRKLASIIVCTLVAIWLFSDTVRHYFPNRSNSNVLRFSHYGTYQDFETWRELIRAFELENPGITIKQEYVVGWYGLYDRKLRQQFLAHCAPHVALVQAISFQQLANHFATLPQSPADVSTLLDPSAMDPIALQMYRLDGAQRAMPVTGGNLLIYYNKNCFERASKHRGQIVPLPSEDWTMGEFESTARMLTCDFDNDGQLDQFGFWQPRWVYYLPFLWSFGADVLVDSRQNCLLTGDAATAALEFYRRMRVGPTRYAPHPDEMSQLIQDTGFLTGRTAMCINGPWFIPTLNNTNVRDQYGVANIPAWHGHRATRVTWDGIAASRHLSPAEFANAIKFIAFVNSPAGQRILTRSGRALPARSSELEWFVRTHPDEAALRFVKALAYSRPEPQSNRFKEFDQTINRHLAAMVDAHNPITTAEFLARLESDHSQK
ncbi:MAG: sugar ABC transporter substrate-binding protein [Phycisphaerae bacterium]|nr:sugar ABC transporter substrate-binding protein [Phycisphaerales bacterium]